MSDNVVEFPSGRELVIEFDPVARGTAEEEIETALVALICNLNGIYMTAEIEWEQLMHACLIAATNCATQAGYTAEQFNEIVKTIEVEDID